MDRGRPHLGVAEVQEVREPHRPQTFELGRNPRDQAGIPGEPAGVFASQSPRRFSGLRNDEEKFIILVYL